MRKKRNTHATDQPVTFEKQTPPLYLPLFEIDILHDRPWIKDDPAADAEYTRNTTTWD